MCASAQVEKILGEWRTVDDVTGVTKGVVEFYKGDNGLYYGKIIKVFWKGQELKDTGFEPSYSGSGTTYSGGGGGYFGGNSGVNGHSGAGGSGYVGGVPGFVYNKKFYGNLNEVGVNKGNGYSYIRYVEVV